MKPGPYFVLLLLAVACVVLVVALILMGHTNQKLQVELQAQQQALNQGILGQQAQQISGGVLQDMASAAAGSPGIRQLLEKHGYRVSPTHSATPSVAGGASTPSGTAINAPGKDLEASAKAEGPTP